MTQPRILFLGDSLTAGLFASDEAHTFRALVTDAFAAIPIEVATSGGSSSGPLISQAEITAAAADVAVIELGTNDATVEGVTPEDLADNLRILAGWARDGNADCAIVFLSTWGSGREAFNAAISDVADDFGGHYVSLGEIWPSADNFGPAEEFSPWPGIAANVVNEITNPRLLADPATGPPYSSVLPADWTDFADGHGTYLRDCIDNGDGTFYHETIYTVSADDLTGGEHLFMGLAAYCFDAEISPGDHVTFAMEYQSLAANAGAAWISISAQDNTGGQLTNLGVSADWTPVKVTMTASATATYPIAWIRAQVHADEAHAGNTLLFRFRHPRVTKTAAAVAYFDGSMGPGYQWNGTADHAASVALYYTDNWHPNDSGHAAIAAAVWPEVQSALAPAGFLYRTAFTLDGLNLNDGTVYSWLPGAELGARQKTWNERKSYTGAVAQYNVSEAASVPMKFPISVQGRHLADLDAKVQAINAKIDGCSSASPKTLVFAGTTYHIVTTPRVAYVLDEAGVVVFRALIDLMLNRLP